jgi:hypothetical protein
VLVCRFFVTFIALTRRVTRQLAKTTSASMTASVRLGHDATSKLQTVTGYRGLGQVRHAVCVAKCVAKPAPCGVVPHTRVI